MAQFHTSSAQHANPLRKKSNTGEPSRFREAKSAKLKKKSPVERSTRPPPPGERKALRKRIVLSNPNALEVEGMQDLSPASMVDARLRGTVVGLPVPMLEQLRAVQAFKPKQGWSIFRRPGTVMRKESLELARLVEGISADGGEAKGRVVKRVVTGVRGAGKSVHLLQAMAMGFLKEWVVFTVPESEFSGIILQCTLLCVCMRVCTNWPSPGFGECSYWVCPPGRDQTYSLRAE